MFDVDSFLNRAKKGAGVESDYALAVKVLGYKRASTVTNWRSGYSMPDERAILALCKLSGDDPDHVAACIQSMRAANDDAANLWRRIADRLKGGAGAIAAAVVVLFALSALDVQAPAAAATLSSDCYVKWIGSVLLLRVLWRWLRLTRNHRVTA